MADTKTVGVLACENCGSQSLSWAPSVVNESDVVDGRLRVHDVSCVFALGCDECSETLHVISAEAAAAKLTAIAELIEADKEDDAASLELENNPEPENPQTPEQWAAYSRHLDAKDRKRATTKRRADALHAVGGAK